MPTGQHFIRHSEQTIIEIRSSKESTTPLANRLGVHPRYVRKVRAGHVRKTIKP